MIFKCVFFSTHAAIAFHSLNCFNSYWNLVYWSITELSLCLNAIHPCFSTALHNNNMPIIIIHIYNHVLSFLTTGLHHFLVALVGPAGPSLTTTWHTIHQPAILTSTLTPCTGRPHAPYILWKLPVSSLHRVTGDGVVTPPATWLSTSASPGRSCCARPRGSHATTLWRSRQRSWNCTHATSNATQLAPPTTNPILTDPTRQSSIWAKRKRRRRKREKVGGGCRWGRLIGPVLSLTSISLHTSTLVNAERVTCPWLKTATQLEEGTQPRRRMKRRMVREKWTGEI